MQNKDIFIAISVIFIACRSYLEWLMNISSSGRQYWLKKEWQNHKPRKQINFSSFRKCVSLEIGCRDLFCTNAPMLKIFFFSRSDNPLRYRGYICIIFQIRLPLDRGYCNFALIDFSRTAINEEFDKSVHATIPRRKPKRCSHLSNEHRIDGCIR